MKPPLISIIVPVYNASNSVTKCLESIILQTYSNWECIVINDGSTDESEIIIEKISQRNEKIKKYSKNNEGVSAARNYGLSMSSGEFICFVDADDYLEINYLENFNFLKHNNADMYVQGYRRIKDSLEISLSPRMNEGIVDINTGFEVLTETTIIRSSWCKLYRREIIYNHGIKFDKRLNSGEDHLFSVEYFKFCEKIFLSSERGYNYVSLKDNSLSSQTPRRLETLHYLVEINRHLLSIFSIYGEMNSKAFSLINKDCNQILVRLIKGIIKENANRKQQSFYSQILLNKISRWGISRQLKVINRIFFFNCNVNKIPIYKILLKLKDSFKNQ